MIGFNLQIQVYFKAMGSYSSVCGAAIRSGGDLWIYDYCREGKSGRIRAYECDDMTLRIEEYGADYKVLCSNIRKLFLASIF